uniref:NAD-dependent epimerase/dehydratase domain-containing protein n=1 Tax=Quercus lobata TaxID=97700 RepID=A0A7N2RE25_QUELO
MSGAESKVVCVTGASGYIASWLVKLLLQHGYTVKATVRDPNDPKKTEHLLALDGSFDSVVDGCEGVFIRHLLFITKSRIPRSCAEVQSIKRVVITSSMTAVAFNGEPLAPDVVIDETWFSNAAVCEKSKLWYMLSKTLAEEAAWKSAKENAIDMVAINPGLVIGPFLQPTLNSSVEAVLKLVNGAERFPNITYRWFDVRDVANAHILAFENPSASGRYCLVGRVMHSSEVMKILHELFPDLNLPEKCADNKPFVPIYLVSKERAESLGLNFTPVEVSLKDTVESLKEKNFLSV